MLKQTTALQQLIRPEVESLGYELLGCEFTKQDRQAIFRVYIDHPQGIGVDDCQKVSRQISAVLDVEDPIAGEYHLEISSPGIERPLFVIEHYQRFVGYPIYLVLKTAINNCRRYQCLLTDVNNSDGCQEIKVDVAGELLTIPFSNIAKANLREA